MNKIYEFFKEVEFRVKTPLITAFIISWMLINWKVTIGICMDNDSLIAEGYKSKIDLVHQNYSLWRYYLYPLLSALAYIFIFSFIRYGIHFFTTWLNKWGTHRVLKISEDGAISVKKYMALRKDYEARTKTLIDIIEKESSVNELNQELDAKIHAIGLERKEIEIQLNNIRRNSSLQKFNGYWHLNFNSKAAGFDGHTSKRVQFSNGHIYKANYGEDPEKLYSIIHYGFNSSSSEVIFILKDKDNQLLHQVFVPLMHENFSRLRNWDPEGLIQSMEQEFNS